MSTCEGDAANEPILWTYPPTVQIPAQTGLVDSDRLIITLKAGEVPSAINEIAADIKGCVLQELPPIRAYTIQIPAVKSETELRSIIEALEAEPEVESVSPDYHGAFQGVPD